MGTSNIAEITKTLQKEAVSLFTLNDFKRIFAIDNKNTLYKKVQRLKDKEIIKKLIKGKYLFLFQKPHDFLIANFLYRPSYISLESALSFYGIITGFPYQVTSVTTKKSKRIIVDEKGYEYSQIKNDLFWGYEKKEDFLIADKEKAFLDYLYYAYKGLRSKDLKEFDLSAIKKEKLKKYLGQVKDKNFRYFLKKIKI